jgi:hypothetical protein
MPWTRCELNLQSMVKADDECRRRDWTHYYPCQMGRGSLCGKPAKRSHGFTPKEKATFIALLAIEAEAKTDAAAAWAGAMMRVPHGQVDTPWMNADATV